MGCAQAQLAFHGFIEVANCNACHRRLPEIIAIRIIIAEPAYKATLRTLWPCRLRTVLNSDRMPRPAFPPGRVTTERGGDAGHAAADQQRNDRRRVADALRSRGALPRRALSRLDRSDQHASVGADPRRARSFP